MVMMMMMMMMIMMMMMMIEQFVRRANITLMQIDKKIRERTK